MELKPKVYAIDQAAELLSLSFLDVHRLVAENQLSKVPAITAESILNFAKRKGIDIGQAAEILGGKL